VQNKAPKQAATPEYAAVANYAYHLDAASSSVSAQALYRAPWRDVARSRGRHESHPGDRRAADQSGPLAGNVHRLHGSAIAAAGPALQTPFVSQKHVLFNDSALAL
jgi:hypothetical protein